MSVDQLAFLRDEVDPLLKTGGLLRFMPDKSWARHCAAQLLYQLKLRPGRTHGSHVGEDMVWYEPADWEAEGVSVTLIDSGGNHLADTTWQGWVFRSWSWGPITLKQYLRQYSYKAAKHLKLRAKDLINRRPGYILSILCRIGAVTHITSLTGTIETK